MKSIRKRCLKVPSAGTVYKVRGLLADTGLYFVGKDVAALVGRRYLRFRAGETATVDGKLLFRMEALYRLSRQANYANALMPLLESCFDGSWFAARNVSRSTVSGVKLLKHCIRDLGIPPTESEAAANLIRQLIGQPRCQQHRFPLVVKAALVDKGFFVLKGGHSQVTANGQQVIARILNCNFED